MKLNIINIHIQSIFRKGLLKLISQGVINHFTSDIKLELHCIYNPIKLIYT